MKLEPNTTISHYKILSQIGKGGMGEVYLAEDTKLGRKVAIKFLSEDFKNDKEKLDRFIQEAKAASALNHPNIITVFEIGTADAVDFIATEYIDGKDLNHAMSERKLSIDEAIDIAIQAASALRAAHEAGIVHRDIKSDNVMLRNDGIVKVLDFGLAKLTQKTDPDSQGLENETIAKVQTQPGMVMGTPNYMSPEQVRGRGVDHRTDIFSLGVLLYEMLSQVRPFEGETTSDVMAAVLTRAPRPLSEIERNLPPELEKIVFRALEKEKDNRYPSASDLLADLSELKQELQIRERLKTTETPDREPTRVFERRSTVETGSFSSVAVLPFTNMSADEDNEFFCDGLAEELLGTLAKIGELKVAARSTSFAFKGSGKSAMEIGDLLGVGTILDGSVRKSGNKVRISVQLVDTSNGYQLWSEQFDREMKDIFEIQDEIALSVADALKVRLLGEEREAVLKRYTNNAEAYQLYLRGRFFFFKRTPEGFMKAIDYFERAIEIDPDYAIAYSGLADCWVFRGFYEAVAPAEAETALTPLVEKGLELDDSLAETLVSSAIKKTFYDWDFDGSLTEFRRAIENNPRYAFAHHLESTTLVLLGLGDEAVAAEDRACELEPFTAIFNGAVAWWYYFSDILDKSIDQSLKTIEIAPNHFFAHWVLGLSYARKGQYAEALASLSNARSLTNGSQHIVADIGRVYAMAGKQDESLRILADLERDASEGYVSAVNFARLYAGLGNREKVLDYIDKAVSERAIKLPFTLIDPMLEDYWSEPRFRAAALKVGVKPCYPVSTVTDRSLEAPTMVMHSDTAEEETAEEPAVKKRSFPFTWLVAGIFAVLIAIAAVYLGYSYFAAGDRVIDSIAVMPFVNESGNADTEYLSDGMTDTLISSLSQIPKLNVKARSSVFRFKGKDGGVRKIGSELNVQAVLTGRVTQRSDQISLSLELVDVSTENVIWSRKYDRTRKDLIALQNEIAEDVQTRIKATLTGSPDKKGAETRTKNPEAYTAYLKGLYHYNKRDSKDYLKAIGYYREAIKLDPDYALPYVGLANAMALFNAGDLDYPTRRDKIFEALEKARSLAPDSSEVHASLGSHYLFWRWNWEKAESEFRTAIKLNPGYATAHHWYAEALCYMGRFEECFAHFEKALEIDPLSLVIICDRGRAYFWAGRYEEAKKEFERGIVLDPDFARSYRYLSDVFEETGELEKAAEDSGKPVEQRDRGDRRQRETSELIEAIRAAGSRGYWQKRLDLGLARAQERSDLPSYWQLANIYAKLGEKDKAFAQLDKAMEKQPYVAPTLWVAPTLDPLRSDPRFDAILDKTGLFKYAQNKRK